MFSPAIWQQIMFASKVTGALSVFGGLAWGLGRWLIRAVNKVTSINSNVVLLMTNHLPHVAQGIEDMRKEFNGVKMDVLQLDAKLDGFSARLEDSKKSLDTFGAAFIQHLENGSDRRQV